MIKKVFLCISLGCVFAALGCSTVQRSSLPNSMEATPPLFPGMKSTQQKDIVGPPEAFGPGVQQGSSVYGPELNQVRPVVLVLGPGMARGFAYVGVLEALHENKIPIAAICGAEIGALVGALYATSSSVNQFEWKILKLKEELFVSRTLLGGQKARSELNGPLIDFIRQVFGDKKLSDALIPIHVVGSTKKQSIELIQSGSLSQAVERTMGGQHSEPSVGMLVDDARSLNLGPVVVVDVLTSRDSARARDQRSKADFELRPDLVGIGYLDFNQKTEAAFRGKSAIIQNISEIKRQVGGTIIRE